MSRLTVDQATWDEWEAERLKRARFDLDNTAWQGARTAASTDDLLERILDLETRLYLKQVVLESMAEMLNARAGRHLAVAA